MSTMVNLGIGFQEPLTRPGVKLDEKMSNYSSDSERSRGIYKFQLAGKWSESKKMSCHAILKNLYGPKMDVILTISFKITAEIEIRKLAWVSGLPKGIGETRFSFPFSPRNAWYSGYKKTCDLRPTSLTVSLCKSICYFIHSLSWNAFTLFFYCQ